MSQIFSIDENCENSQKSSNQGNPPKFWFCSEQKINPSNINDNFNDDFISNDIFNYGGCNSCSITGNNKLFKSFINSKNNKNKELSLLYLINTFNKSYSNNSSKNNQIIIDFPKISKKLFPNSHLRHKSSTNLDCQTFQKNLYVPKNCGKIINNFFSSVYSGNEFESYTISPKKGEKKKGFFYNSGNKLSSCAISPFSNANYRYEKMFNKKTSSCNLNYGFNFDIIEQKESNKDVGKDKFYISSLLDKIMVSEKCEK